MNAYQKVLRLFFMLVLPMSLFGHGISDAIVMGEYSAGIHSFSDSRINAGHGNAYSQTGAPYWGQASDELYYRFSVLGKAEISISTCGSNFDTYIHLLNSDGSPLEHNDDNGPLCRGTAASLKTNLQAGTYYLVIEGFYLSSGTVNCLTNFTVQLPSASVVPIVDLGNYVRSWQAVTPLRTDSGFSTLPLSAVRQSTTYFDGLGRPLQTVSRQSSLASGTVTALDLVSPVIYDAFGRETKKLLPYQASSADGLLKDSALAEQLNFYSSTAGPLAGQGEHTFYGLTEYESSPLNRPLKEMAPGDSWAGAGKGVSLSYQVNANSDSVRLWQVTEVPGKFGLYSTTGFYPAATLYKTTTTDEASHLTIEYKDKQGQVVLKKVQAVDTPSAGHSGFICTYYIYDDMNRLRAVIQPNAVEEMNSTGNWQPGEVMLAELSFRYQYDGRGRMITKKVPGAGAVDLVYDARGRLAMTQDANMRSQGKWLVTIYDALNRPVRTGFWQDSHALAWHAALAHDLVDYPVVPVTGWELLTEVHYDDYEGLPEGLVASLVAGYAPYLDAAAGAPDYAQPLQVTGRVRGMVTWSRTKVLGEEKYLSSLTLYDDKGRAIQSQSINYTEGLDIITNQYSFDGRLLGSYLVHNGAASTSIQVATRNRYDVLGRPVQVEKNINGSGWKVTTTLSYDALGQLKEKKLAPYYNNGQGLETQRYDHNIRGWLLGVNREGLNAANAAGGSGPFFGFELGYDKTTSASGEGFATPQLTGNIAGMAWKTAGAPARRKYDFTYDPANRFGKADYAQTNGDPAVSFSTHGTDPDNGHLVKYDLNGNILNMAHHGISGNAPNVVIDALHYDYYPQSNKLKRVTDDHNDSKSTLGDFKYDPLTKGESDYGYDSNGSMVTDRNKKLDGPTGIDLTGGAITYNHLNLPDRITVAGKGSITYLYDAGGNKLQKTVQEDGKPVRVTTYLGGFLYEDGQLQSMAHEEGRIRPLRNNDSSITGYAFDYFLKDHLGNVRMVLTDEQQQDAYPVATLEDGTLEQERIFYKISDDGSRVHKSSVPGYPVGDEQSGNSYVQQLNGNGHQVGASIVLKVMAGDQVNIRAESWYRSNGAPTAGPQGVLTDMAAALVGGLSGAAGAKSVLLNAGQQQALASAAASLLNHPAQDGGPVKPRAALNWLLLDEQLNPITSGSASDPVGQDQQLKTHQITGQQVSSNGYLYIYVSNESTDVNVIFDNLQVTHTRGPILEETHYYPFGLTMAGISSKAAGKVENKKKYNGIEFNEDLGLDAYDAFYRNLDPQTGRWWQVDPKVENMLEWSPYVSNFDNPITYIDPLGDEPVGENPPQNGLLQSAMNIFMTGAKWVNSNLNPLTPIVETIVGTSYESNFTESKPRSLSLAEVTISLIPGGKIEAMAVKTIEKGLVKTGEKSVGKGVEKIIEGGENLSKNARFIVEKEGLTVDTKTISKGSYQQPDGGRTDVLQNLSHHNKSTNENVGYSHTHEPFVNINPKNGKPYTGADRIKSHRPTYEEVKNIESGRAKKNK